MMNCLGKCKKGQCEPFCRTVGMKPCLCTKSKEDLCKRCCAPVNAVGDEMVEKCTPYIFPNRTHALLRDNARCSLGYCNKVRII